MSAPAPAEGWVAAELRDEHPGLGIASIALAAPPGGGTARSPRGVRERLDLLAGRMRGADALVLRQRPVPHAYRVFYRHVGLDPDVTPVPAEAAMLERLVRGGLRSRGLLEDARTVAVLETGVPLWALDADALDGLLGLRTAEPEEPLDGVPLPAGRIVVADARRALAALFAEPGAAQAPGRRTTRLLLFAIRVPGIGAMEVTEALWTAAEVLRAG